MFIVKDAAMNSILMDIVDYPVHLLILQFRSGAKLLVDCR